jgi:hypothetical protein
MIHIYFLLGPYQGLTSCAKLIRVKLKNLVRNHIPNAKNGKEGDGVRGADRWRDRSDTV